jgi:hypothetical protein
MYGYVSEDGKTLEKCHRHIPKNGQNEIHSSDIRMSLSFHVETVVLMSMGRNSRAENPQKKVNQLFYVSINTIILKVFFSIY